MSRIVLGALLGIAFSAGQAIAEPMVQTFKLDNGLEVAFLPLPGAPVVAVQTWVHAGAKDDAPAREGTARLLESLAWQGSLRLRPQAHAQYIGAIGGTVAAAVDNDASFFGVVVPSAQLDYAVMLEAERFGSLRFERDNVTAEKADAKRELAELNASPLTKMQNLFWRAAFTKHPYGLPAVGTEAGLGSITTADVTRFYQSWYRPNNALIVVAGDTTLAAVKAAVTKHFGSMLAGGLPTRPALALAEPAQAAPRKQVIDAGQVGVVIGGWKLPAAKHADIYPLQVAALLLGSGESGRLRQRVRYPDKKGVVLGIDASAQVEVREDVCTLVMLAAFADPAASDALEAAMLDEVKRLVSKPPTSDELRRIKNQIQASLLFSMESAAGIAEQIGKAWVLTGDATALRRDVDALEKVTATDVVRVARQYLTADALTVVVMPPRKAAGGGQ